MLQNYQFLVGNDPNRRYPRDVNNLDELVTSIVNEVVGGASVDLDTLGELSTALQNNPDFLTTLQGHDAQLLSAVALLLALQTWASFLTRVFLMPQI